jgi:hypothetical protein
MRLFGHPPQIRDVGHPTLASRRERDPRSPNARDRGHPVGGSSGKQVSELAVEPGGIGVMIWLPGASG